MKKIRMAVVAAAVIAMTASTAAMAEANEKVEIDGLSFEIPDELKDQLIVETSDLPDNVLVEVYEKGSVEAAKAMDENREGAGWIFSISKIPEDEATQLRFFGMDGMEIFGKGEGSCLIYSHPTDVSFVRESVDKMREDEEAWSKVNNWAYDNVRNEILASNPAYEPEVYTNTDLDMYFTMAANGYATDYVLRSLDINQGADLDPKTSGDNSYIEKLAEDFTYEYAPEELQPLAAGEYYVMEFPGENLRIDFFKSNGNLIREVTSFAGEEYESIYYATAKNADNAGENVTSIVAAWCESLAGGEAASSEATNS